MKKLVFLFAFFCFTLVGFSQKKPKKLYTSSPVVNSDASTADVQGTWMYGNFSTTEYWSTAPKTYLGNALTFAIAFKFNADGSYEQYFTSSSVLLGVSTYHQSLTKGTYKVDATAQTITTIPSWSHYKRTRGSKVEEDRDMLPKEISGNTTYLYEKGSEHNGTASIRLTIKGTNSPLNFLKKDF